MSASQLIRSNESSWVRNLYLWFGRMLGIRDLDAHCDSDGTQHRPINELMDINFSNTQFNDIYFKIRTNDGRIFSYHVERDIISQLDSEISSYGNIIQLFYRIVSLPVFRNMNWNDTITTVLDEIDEIRNERQPRHQNTTQNTQQHRVMENTGNTRNTRNANISVPFTNLFNMGLGSGMAPINIGRTANSSQIVSQQPVRGYYYTQTITGNNENNLFEDIVRRIFGNIDMEDVRIVISQSDIDKLPIVKYKKDQPLEELTDNTCAICQDNYKDDEELAKLPCEHYFHKECIFKMLKEYSNKCPTCRTEVAQGIPFNQNNSSTASTVNSNNSNSNLNTGINGFEFTYNGSTPITQEQTQYMTLQLEPERARRMASQMMNGNFSDFFNFANAYRNSGNNTEQNSNT